MTTERSNHEEEKHVPVRSSTPAATSSNEEMKAPTHNPHLSEPSPDLYDYEGPFEYEQDHASESASVLTLYLSQNENGVENNEESSDEQENEEEKTFQEKTPFFENEDEYGGMRTESRAMTAPARPQTEIEQFRKSRSFL